MPAPVASLGTESVMCVCHRLCASAWTGLRKPEPGFPQTSPHVPFSFVDSALYLFVINILVMGMTILSAVSPLENQ